MSEFITDICYRLYWLKVVFIGLFWKLYSHGIGKATVEALLILCSEMQLVIYFLILWFHVH